jgi:hypothetical protein
MVPTVRSAFNRNYDNHYSCGSNQFADYGVAINNDEFLNVNFYRIDSNHIRNDDFKPKRFGFSSIQRSTIRVSHIIRRSIHSRVGRSGRAKEKEKVAVLDFN